MHQVLVAALMTDSSLAPTTYSPATPRGSPPPSSPLIWPAREKFPLSKSGALLSSPSRSEALHNDDGHGQPSVCGLLGLQPWPPPQLEDELLKKGGVMSWDVMLDSSLAPRTRGARMSSNPKSRRPPTHTRWLPTRGVRRLSTHTRRLPTRGARRLPIRICRVSSSCHDQPLAWGLLGLQPWPPPSSSRTS